MDTFPLHRLQQYFQWCRIEKTSDGSHHVVKAGVGIAPEGDEKLFRVNHPKDVVFIAFDDGEPRVLFSLHDVEDGIQIV